MIYSLYIALSFNLTCVLPRTRSPEPIPGLSWASTKEKSKKSNITQSKEYFMQTIFMNRGEEKGS